MPSAQSLRAKRKPTAIDLFSGCGGLTRGLKDAGFRVTAAVEIDQKARETYELNHPDVLLYGQDIRKVSPLAMMADSGLKPGDLHLLAGCPPCQGFSRLRTKNRRTSVRDSRNNLLTEFERFVRAMKPQSVMFENVPSLIRDKRFKRLCNQLHGLGYKTIAQVLNAADYSVPQRRKRLIMLASRMHQPKLAAPRKSRITVRQTIGTTRGLSSARDKLHALRERRSEAVRALIAMIPKNGGSRASLGAEHTLSCHKNSDGFHDVYGRMPWDDVSPTITSGCHNPSKGRFLHPSRNRAITLREAALLQGFPKSYRFEISHGKEAIALMIGNALPPPFIAAHAKQLRKGISAAAQSKARQRRIGARGCGRR